MSSDISEQLDHIFAEYLHLDDLVNDSQPYSSKNYLDSSLYLYCLHNNYFFAIDLDSNDFSPLMEQYLETKYRQGFTFTKNGTTYRLQQTTLPEEDSKKYYFERLDDPSER